MKLLGRPTLMTCYKSGCEKYPPGGNFARYTSRAGPKLEPKLFPALNASSLFPSFSVATARSRQFTRCFRALSEQKAASQIQTLWAASAQCSDGLYSVEEKKRSQFHLRPNRGRYSKSPQHDKSAEMDGGPQREKRIWRIEGGRRRRGRRRDWLSPKEALLVQLVWRRRGRRRLRWLTSVCYRLHAKCLVVSLPVQYWPFIYAWCQFFVSSSIFHAAPSMWPEKLSVHEMCLVVLKKGATRIAHDTFFKHSAVFISQ